MRQFCTIFCIVLSCSADAAIRFVTATGAGSLTGSSWINAAPGSNLQSIINVSTPGDQVWVACGVYRTTGTVNRNVCFSLKEGVAVFGSFAGNETTLSQRILSCGPCSELSGEIGLPGIADNSYHVISNMNLSVTAVLDGFIVSGGNDDRPNTLNNGLGGGIYNYGAGAGNNCSPTIRNCVIINNRAVFGGGIFNNGYDGGNANPIISHCIISNNIAIDGGGGIDNFGLSGNASPTIINTAIINNTASVAGGIYCWGGNPGGNSSPSLLNCIVANNSATSGNAGGLIADNSNSYNLQNSGTSSIQVRNSIFHGNTSAGAGPQFAIKGTGSFNATYSSVDLGGQFGQHIITGAGTGNIHTDPLFSGASNPRGLDNCWMTGDDGFTLIPASPCINRGENSGVPTTDLRFMSRIFNSIVDMGTYEFNAGSLDVTFIEFTGRAVNSFNQLSWSVVDEKTDHEYLIARSRDGIRFDSAGLQRVKSSAQINRYIFLDTDNSGTINYYRLHYRRRGGQVAAISRVIVIRAGGSGYPKWSHNVLNRTITFLSDASVESMTLYSPEGKSLVLCRFQSVLRYRKLLPGWYVVRVRTRSGVFVQSFFIQ